MNRKQILAFIGLAALLCVLPGCGKEEEGDVASNLPTEYTVGESTVLALSTGDEVNLEERRVVSYTYDGLIDAGTTVAGYVSQVTAKEEGAGFSVVDEELVRTDKPDFTTVEGEVLLAKDIEMEEEEEPAEGEEAEPVQPRVICLHITWKEGSCTVETEERNGKVTSPPPPATQPSAPAMSTLDALDFFKQIPPSELGLSGTTMEKYNIYVQEGTVVVDKRPCIQLNVYSIDNDEQTNEFAGSYLMTADGLYLYRLDPVSDTVETIRTP